MNGLKRFLLARPIDLKFYRDARATGVTALLYALPWSVLFLILAAIVVAIFRAPIR